MATPESIAGRKERYYPKPVVEIKSGLTRREMLFAGVGLAGGLVGIVSFVLQRREIDKLKADQGFLKIQMEVLMRSWFGRKQVENPK